MHKHQEGQALSVGRPVPNKTVYVLDKDEEPVPIGATGTMWIGGVCVSRGYINLPESTNARYKQDKFLGNGYVCHQKVDSIDRLVELPCSIPVIFADRRKMAPS